MGIDKSNPFERSGDEVELYREYGSGGRKITFQDIPGVKEGVSSAQEGIGEATQGAPVSPDTR